MFGTIVTNPTALSKEERARYAAFYCGLCHQLDAGYGSIGCATLTYDMTFVDLLLSSLYTLPEEDGKRHCMPHPIKKHSYVVTAATPYAADMNIFLAYYQFMDDWNDDKNRVAREKARMLEEHLPALREKWPRQCAAIEDNLALLGEMEKENELNPDLPANTFGQLMGELLVWREDEYADTLHRMGAALGRYVYLLDAVNDLRADIKKQRYNPLVAQMDTDFAPILTMMMAECTDAFEALPIRQDAHILQNILYSGVWQKMRARGKKEGVDP